MTTRALASHRLRVDGGIRFLHEVEDGVLCSHHTHPFKLAARIDPNDQWLMVGFLLVAQLHIEQPYFVALWSCFATLEQVACFGGSTRHERNPACVNNRDSQGISLAPGHSLGDMTLPGCKTGLDTIPSVSPAWAQLEAVFVRVARKRSCSP